MSDDVLGCEVIVFRAITRASDFDKEKMRPKIGLFLRKPKDTKGLSVDYNCQPHECGSDLSARRAIASLHTGRVCSLGLKIVADTKSHANIEGLPFREDDAQGAEQLAADLVEQARIAHVF
jgi:hypothetical protein